jgi:hypothetical protein
MHAFLMSNELGTMKKVKKKKGNKELGTFQKITIKRMSM